MGVSLGKSIALTVCATLVLLCSCEKHHPGEYPEVQRNLVDLNKSSPGAEEPATSADSSPAAATPPAKPTPVEFFPTKPR